MSSEGPLDTHGGGHGARPVAGSVLVVDDSALVRDAVVEILAANGYQAVAVPDGCRALDFLREHGAVGLVLMDMVMPGVDGWQFLAAQRLDPRLAAVPVVALTGLDFPFGSVGAPSELPPVTLTKPIGSQDLLKAVRRYCR
jgi:CheY-like chemotaxis protein